MKRQLTLNLFMNKAQTVVVDEFAGFNVVKTIMVANTMAMEHKTLKS